MEARGSLKELKNIYSDLFKSIKLIKTHEEKNSVSNEKEIKLESQFKSSSEEKVYSVSIVYCCYIC